MHSIRKRLQNRIQAMVIPLALLPFLVFAGFSIRSHFIDTDRAVFSGFENTFEKFRIFLQSHVRMTQESLLALENSVRTLPLVDLQKKFDAAVLDSPLLEVIHVSSTAGDILMSTQKHMVGGKVRNHLFTGESRAVWVSAIFQEEEKSIRFFLGQKVESLKWGTVYLIGDTLVSGVAGGLDQKSVREGVSGALMEIGTYGNQVSLTNRSDKTYWSQIKEFEKIRGRGRVSIGDREFMVFTRRLLPFETNFILAKPVDLVFGTADRVLYLFIVIFSLLILAVVYTTIRLGRDISGKVNALADKLDKVASDDFDVQVDVIGEDEVADLQVAFNKMVESQRYGQLSIRVQYRAVMEFLNCDSVDRILRSTVELVCAQVEADTSWFIPHKYGESHIIRNQKVFEGLHGWFWNQHRCVELKEENSGKLPSYPEGKIFEFVVRDHSDVIGTLYVGYSKVPNTHLDSLLNTLVALVGSVVRKRSELARQAILSTELELAGSIRRNTVVSSEIARQARIAYHYSPTRRLASDWFYLVQGSEGDQVYVIMGEVIGSGLAEGIASTAIKGALDVIETILSNKRDAHLIDDPSILIELINEVAVRSTGDSEIKFKCLVARVDFKASKVHMSNSGFSIPIHVRNKEDMIIVRQLEEVSEQEVREEGSSNNPTITYRLKPGDLLMFYADGIRGNVNLKKEVFQRMLFRRLRQTREYKSADQLKEEVLELFKYYTQGQELVDDVYFLVLQLKPVGFSPNHVKVDKSA
jgi:serine phosphatase RsbU (regulator of sigma subunit)/HAMP domain-containing protein